MFDILIDLLYVVRFVSSYTSSDYPVEVKLRQYLHFQASVKSIDKTLSALAENCYATPSMDRNDASKYYIIKDGYVIVSNILIGQYSQLLYHKKDVLMKMSIQFPCCTLFSFSMSLKQNTGRFATSRHFTTFFMKN